MSWWEAAVLGLVQGLTEFLPVSSSGHVSLGAIFLGQEEMPLTTVIVVHAGTLLATLLAMREDVWALTRTTVGALTSPRTFLTDDGGRVVAGVVCASVPTAAIGLALEDRVEGLAHLPAAVGACLVVTGAVLMFTRGGGGGDKLLPLRLYVLIGIAQGLAVLPGISRSGTTIAAGMLLGLSGPAAFRFSFLLSIPAVAGAVVLKLGNPEAWAQINAASLIAGGVAFGSGYLSLLALRRLVTQGRLWIFAIYLFPVGAGVIAWDLASG